MSNKFKIRNLENERRRIDKQIAELKKEDAERALNKVEYIRTLTEVRESVIESDGFKQTITQSFYYTFKRIGKKVVCEFRDSMSNIKGEGVAVCHEDDEFNLNTGCIIAERRAVADYYKQIENVEVRRLN